MIAYFLGAMVLGYMAKGLGFSETQTIMALLGSFILVQAWSNGK